MKKIVVVAAMFTILLSLCNYPVSAYEQYFTYPGTRAMGMAGAFVAQANDSSAVWYNPAGLMQPGAPQLDLTAEYGKLPQRDSSGKYGSKNSLKFASIAGSLEKYYMGISYFKPYQISLNLDTVCAIGGSCPIGRVDASYEQWSLAFANMFMKDRVSIGGTIDYLYPGTDRLTTEPQGWGWSAGALVKLLDTKSLDISGGILYRSDVEVNYIEEDITTPDEEVISFYLPNRPKMYSVGFHTNSPTQFVILSVNGQYDKVFWSDAFVKDDPFVSFDTEGMNYTKISFGGEFLLPFSESFSIAIRGGFSESTPEDESTVVKINSMTFGIGLNIKENFAIDIASEKRDFSGAGGSNNEYSFWSSSISYQY